MLDVKCSWLTDPLWYKMEQTHPQTTGVFHTNVSIQDYARVFVRKIETISSLQVVNNHVLDKS